MTRAVGPTCSSLPPQPELLSGSLRQNLDPFSQYDDATLNDALRAAGLYSLQNDDGERKITLDSTIASGGGNLSVGQRQILALARAIVRGSKLLILDEGMSPWHVSSTVMLTCRGCSDFCHRYLSPLRIYVSWLTS